MSTKPQAKIEVIEILDSEEEPDLKVTEPESSCKKELPTTPKKDESLKRSIGSGGSSSPRKKQLSRGSREVVKHLKHRGPVRLFPETIDTGKVSDMINILNQSRSGVIPKSSLNLEAFYSGIGVSEDDSLALVVDCHADCISPSYDAGKVIIPKEKHAEHLFNIITQVFSNPTNCGYFNDQELDQVFGIISLSEKAQMLFARMIQRKYCWRRSVTINYPQISEDLTPHFDELERHGLMSSNTDNASLETLLTMVPANVMTRICQKMNCYAKGNKKVSMQQLLKMSSNRPLFPGMKTSAAALRNTVVNDLGHCICLPEEVISLVDRIVTLFIPSQDITAQLADVFLKLTMIKEGTLRFPEVPVQYYPVFENREHLMRYIEGRNKLREAQMPLKDPTKYHDLLKTLSQDAQSHLTSFFEQNPKSCQDTQVPRHVTKFREEYVYMKILTTCLKEFRRKASLKTEAVEILRYLIRQDSLLQKMKGDWYEELALIEMFHHKNLEAAVLATVKGLSLPNMSETTRYALTKRATVLYKRKGTSQDAKLQLKNVIDKEILSNTPVISICGNALEGNQVGHKSTWSMDMGGGDKGYMSVEHRAQLHYKKNGYPEGWHCEGCLPLTLFALLFWDELFCVPVPAAYLSAYQQAPLDLYTSDFYKNRKEQIDRRVTQIRTMAVDELGDTIRTSFEIKKPYESLMPQSPYLNGERLRDMVRCIGSQVVAGICERLAHNFCGWKAGFPDLLVWNSSELKCKFVEVKGPGDSLSAKQTLWLRYLEDLGAGIEVCEVKVGTKKQ